MAKQSKKAVRYGRGGDHCGACTYFVELGRGREDETGTCERVEGEIGEDMWCKLFKRKSLAEYA